MIGFRGFAIRIEAAALVSGVTPIEGEVAIAGKPGTTARSRAAGGNGSWVRLRSLKKLTPGAPVTRTMKGPVISPSRGVAFPSTLVVATPKISPDGLINSTCAPALNPPRAGVTRMVRVAIDTGGLTGPSSPPPPPHESTRPKEDRSQNQPMNRPRFNRPSLILDIAHPTSWNIPVKTLPKTRWQTACGEVAPGVQKHGLVWRSWCPLFSRIKPDHPASPAKLFSYIEGIGLVSAHLTRYHAISNFMVCLTVCPRSPKNAPPSRSNA